MGYGELLTVVNSDIGKPLDVLITEKSNVKIQNLQFSISQNDVTGANFETIVPISQVDISKTAILQNSIVSNLMYVRSFSFYLKSPTELGVRISLTHYNDSDFPINLSVVLVTFGGNAI